MLLTPLLMTQKLYPCCFIFMIVNVFDISWVTSLEYGVSLRNDHMLINLKTQATTYNFQINILIMYYDSFLNLKFSILSRKRISCIVENVTQEVLLA